MSEYKQGGNQLRPLTEQEKQYSIENHDLVYRFLNGKRLDLNEFYDVVIFDFLLAVEVYLNNKELSGKYNFEQVAYTYMGRAILNNYRANNQQKRHSLNGNDISFEDAEVERVTQGSRL